MRQAGRLAALLIGINAVFFAVRLAGTFVDRDAVAAALRDAVDDGALVATDDPGREFGVGLDQWNDCLVLESALMSGDGRLDEALAPRLLRPSEWGSRCRALVDFLADGRPPGGVFTSNRFWHGEATLAAVALRTMSLAAYRGLLGMLCYAGIAAFGLIAYVRLPTRAASTALLPLVVAAFAFSGTHFLGGLISHSPAFCAIWLTATVMLVVAPSRRLGSVLGLALMAGAVEAFTDLMINCALSAAITILTACIAWDARLRTAPLRETVRFCAGVAAAWAAGFAGSYLLKAALTMLLLGWDQVATPFVDQLLLHMGAVGSPGTATETPWSAAILLFRSSWRLSYAASAKYLLLSVALGGWAAAVAGWWRSRDRRAALRAGVGAIAAVGAVVVWVVIFPEQVATNDAFMVRLLVVPYAGGWCWWRAQRVA